MKKIIAILLVLVSLSACATEPRFSKKHKDIDPEFQVYIDDFITFSDGKVTKKDFKGFSMGFHTYKKNSTVVGTCYYHLNEVDISKKWWDSFYTSSWERFELVFHELGHCILKRGHTEDLKKDGFLGWLETLGFRLGIFTTKEGLTDGCPASIMHPEVLDSWCCLLYTSPSPRDRQKSRMPSSA